jgi:hypothetical protein
MDRMNDKLDALWAEYREACPDSEAGPDFMPKLWQRIESRRSENSWVFRRLAQACIMATVALTLLMSGILIPRLQLQPVYQANYVDVLAADASDYTAILDQADSR